MSILPGAEAAIMSKTLSQARSLGRRLAAGGLGRGVGVLGHDGSGKLTLCQDPGRPLLAHQGAEVEVRNANGQLVQSSGLTESLWPGPTLGWALSYGRDVRRHSAGV